MSRSTIIMRANLELARRVEEQWPYAAIAQLCDEHEALEARLATAERELEQLRGWKQIIDGVEHDSGALIGWMERATTAERELAEARERLRYFDEAVHDCVGCDDLTQRTRELAEAREWIKTRLLFSSSFPTESELRAARRILDRADAQEGE